MLTAVEDAQPGEPIQNFQYDGVDARIIAEHVKLLKEGDFIGNQASRCLGVQ